MTRKVHVSGMEMFEIIDSIWFPLTTYNFVNKGDVNIIGIVKVKDTLTGEIKKYIGAAEGKNIAHNEQIVVATGVNLSNCYNFAELYTLMKLEQED